MEQRRPGLIGPLILITLGVLLLLGNLNVLPLSFWEIGFRYWPLLLILVGLEIIIGRQSIVGGLVILVLWVALVAGVLWLSFAQGGAPIAGGTTEQIAQPLGGIKSATVDLNIGVARTEVTALGADSNDLMQGTCRHAEGTRVVKTYSVAGNEGRLALKEEGLNFILGGAGVSRWEIGLNPAIPIALRVNGGVGRATLDLAALNISSLNVDTGIGTLTITTPRTGVTTMRVNGGVGSVMVAIPQGVAARIRVDSGIGATRVDQARFPKLGEVYQSADYAGAANRIDIEVDGGVGSIDIR